MHTTTLERLLDDQAKRRPVILATDLGTGEERFVHPSDLEFEVEIGDAAREAFQSDRSRIVETAAGPVFLNVHNPPLRLVIIGAVHIAQALIPVAQLSGFDIDVIDPRGAFATGARFPEVTLHVEWPDEVLAKHPVDGRTAFVALTHDPKIDDPGLIHALASDCFYIGALGSKKTHAGRLARLAEQGIGEATLARIRGPIGLAIGARSPAEIAIAITAQIINALRHGSAEAA